jgi:hypothetical protein
MVAVFAGFAAGRLVPLQQMGFGLAVAVFLDATIVRSVLVPGQHEAPRCVELVSPDVARLAPKAELEGRLPSVAVPEPASPVGTSQTGGTTAGAYGELMGERS